MGIFLFPLFFVAVAVIGIVIQFIIGFDSIYMLDVLSVCLPVSLLTNRWDDIMYLWGRVSVRERRCHSSILLYDSS